MNTYTTIYFDYNMYQPNKHKLESLRSQFGVVWNEKKTQDNVSYQEILNIFKLFKTENRIINDINLRNRKGATGLWENGISALKIIVFDSFANENPPVLLIYKGNEGEFYIALIKMCINMGCEIGRLIEDESGIHEVFKRKLSFELVEKIKSTEESKEIMKDLFDMRVSELRKHVYVFNNLFIEEWKRCIDSYGYYNINSLMMEIKNINEKLI